MSLFTIRTLLLVAQRYLLESIPLVANLSRTSSLCFIRSDETARFETFDGHYLLSLRFRRLSDSNRSDLIPIDRSWVQNSSSPLIHLHPYFTVNSSLPVGLSSHWAIRMNWVWQLAEWNDVISEWRQVFVGCLLSDDCFSARLGFAMPSTKKCSADMDGMWAEHLRSIPSLYQPSLTFSF